MSLEECLGYLLDPKGKDADRLRAVRAAWLFDEVELRVAAPAIKREMQSNVAEIAAAARGALERLPATDKDQFYDVFRETARRWPAGEEGKALLRQLGALGSRAHEMQAFMLARERAVYPPPRLIDSSLNGPGAFEFFPLERCIAVLLSGNAGDAETARAIESLDWLDSREAVTAFCALRSVSKSGRSRLDKAAGARQSYYEQFMGVSRGVLLAEPLGGTAKLWINLNDAVERIERMLVDPDPRVRVLARDIVGEWAASEDRGVRGKAKKLDETLRLRIAEQLISEFRESPRVNGHLVRQLSVLAPDRPEYRQIMLQAMSYEFNLDGWQAIKGLREQAASGKMMRFAIPSLIGEYGGGRREHDAEVVAIVKSLPDDLRRDAARRAGSSALAGRIELLDLLEAMPEEVRADPGQIVGIMRGNTNADARFRAAAVLQKSGAAPEDVRIAMLAELKGSKEESRNRAAELLGTGEARHYARMRTVVGELRAGEQGTRMRAALVWSGMAGKEDAPVAAALVKAVREGDYGVREGIVAALEKSLVSGKSVSAELKELAAGKGDEAAYARVAVRAVK